MLDEPIGVISKYWRLEPVKTLLQYVTHYTPSSARLITARNHLLHTLTFVLNLNESDPDPLDRCLRTADHVPGAKWMAEKIVRAYYTWRLTIFKGAQPFKKTVPR